MRGIGREDLAPTFGFDLPGCGGETACHGALRSFDIDHLDIKCLDLEVLHDRSVPVEWFDVKMFDIKLLDMEGAEEHHRAMATKAPARPDLDDLDAMLEVWAHEIPNLDPLTEGIVERIEKLAKAFDRSLDETLAATGLDRRSYHVLSKLRRVGPPYRRSAGQLAEHMGLSSGAMTNRLDRMEAAGLIRRLPDPNDRRGILVEPTEAGREIWDRAVGTQAEREAKVAAVLDRKEREELHRLLRVLMRAFPPVAHHPPPSSDEE
jgi:DNA-binding MarR family transcriptional regulator